MSSKAGAIQIYLLDSGLALSNPAVAAEFGGRASIIWDKNNGVPYGDDCTGHGTKVASIAGGNTYGVAKGVTLIEAKITNGCTGTWDMDAVIGALNWLAGNNVPRGTIVIPEIQSTLPDGSCGTFTYDPLDSVVKAAHDAGVIVVIPAGNDGCNTADYSPVNKPEAFVVGATQSGGLPAADYRPSWSRYGSNISTFAPGHIVSAMNQFGSGDVGTGTSFAAPYVAGIFAIVCQVVGSYCNTTSTATLYQNLRDTGTLGTVMNGDGSPLLSPSRFIWQQW